MPCLTLPARRVRAEHVRSECALMRQDVAKLTAIFQVILVKATIAGMRLDLTLLQGLYTRFQTLYENLPPTEEDASNVASTSHQAALVPLPEPEPVFPPEVLDHIISYVPLTNRGHLLRVNST